MTLNQLTIIEAQQGLRRKEFSSLELTHACLEAIKDKDKEINAFIALTEELALKQAKKVDQDMAETEELKPLAGIPCTLKDVFCVQGIRTTAGSKILENYISPYDATVVRRLKEQGMVLLGKVNTDEFTMGSSTETSFLGPTKNPYKLERVPGGSSGGSAAAVASSMCLYSLGTDTGGSIRQPASLCGIVGLKPTYGRISRFGVISMASSLDTIGVLSKTVEDAAIVLQILAGPDSHDSTTPEVGVPNYLNSLNKDIKRLKVGLPKEYFIEGLDPKIKETIDEAVKKLQELGVEILEISLPHTPWAVATYYIITPSEVSSNLARYDGIKYGTSAAINNQPSAISNLLDVYLKTRAAYLGDEAKRRIMLGSFALSAGYYEAYYLKAQKVRTLIKKDFENAFEKVDIILTPTTPETAFKIGDKMTDPLAMYLSDIFTIPANLAGIPGLSIPFGKIEGLPVGIQLLGRQFDEETVLRLGHWLEKSLNGD